MRWIVAGGARDTESGEVARRVTGGIAPGDDLTSTNEQLGERAHACAGNSDEVNGATVGGIEKSHLRRRNIGAADIALKCVAKREFG